ncbi:MAG: PD-(D/E)XK nuclease family protein, partial [Terrimicrobiaceae bacterium]
GGGGRREGAIIVAPDEAEIPGLMDAMQARGEEVRASSAKPFFQTRPFRVLRLAARFLDRPQDAPPAFAVVAEMVRQQDFRARLGDLEAAMDRFQADHLPARFEPSRYPEGDLPKDLLLLEKALHHLLPIPTGTAPIPELAQFFLGFLLELFGSATADDTSPTGRAILRPFKALYEAFTLLQTSTIDVALRPSDFLVMVLDSLEGGSVPAMSSGRETEIIGWLELLSEEASAVAVASCCEGIVPASPVAHPFLPGGLRETLGLRPDKRRLARDAYVMATAARIRPQGLLICAPRKSAAGDPLRPSRVLLQGFSGKSLAARLLHLFAENTENEPPVQTLRTARLQLPGVEPASIRKLSQSAFGSYLRSPKLFYFCNVLGLELPDDSAQEIDSLLGGSLVHAVLGQFANDPSLKESADENEICRFLLSAFEALFKKTFAGLQPATVDFQKDALLEKLVMFARVQAQLSREGWKIVYAENGEGSGDQLSRDLVLPDGRSVTIRGRIDRIDHHPQTRQWRVIDYKTGAKPAEPDKAHFSATNARTPDRWAFACSADGSTRWKGLQFPIYRWLLDNPEVKNPPGWTPGTPAEFVYFFLPEDPGKAGLSTPFPEDRLPEGLEMAVQTAGHILDGKFDDSPDPLTQEDPIYRALCGLSNLVSDTGEDAE